MTDTDRATARAKRAAELKRQKARRLEPVIPTNCSVCWRMDQCIGRGCPIALEAA